MKAGVRLAHYEVLAALGRGGMGEVWRARDTKLRRDVAVKTLPAELAADPERLARLEREATSLAAVSHPNVAAIHGLEEHDGTRFLVLELVEGETLAERLRRGPVPVEQALLIAVQVAEALEAAHERGVVHRDLKPANVKLTPEGRVKVLDFGLAKSLPPATGDGAAGVTVETQIGSLLGTAAYMAPEQARGEPAGRPADLWALGVVLYELLTGTQPFERATATETLARVLETQPDLAALPGETPAGARRLLARCLDKDPRRRLQHAGDARIEIEDALAELAAAPARRAAEAAAARGRRLRGGGLAAAAGVLAVLGGFALWSIAERAGAPAQRGVMHLSIASLGPRSNSPTGIEHLALSADGTRLAYAEQRRLVLRRFDSRAETGVPAQNFISSPFFSPDGDWVGYFDVGLRKVPSGGGVPVLVAEATERFSGATWGSDDTIVYALTSGLYRVGADGGAPELLARPDAERGELRYAWPRFLPDGSAVLLTVVPVDGGVAEARIAWLDLATRETQVLVTGGASAHYVPTGHLVYASGTRLAAVGFDPHTRTVIGTPATLGDIAVAMALDNGATDFAVSAAGTLAYIAAVPPAAQAGSVLVWIDRDGNEEPLALAPGNYGYARVSPDGTRIAIDMGRSGNRDIWIYDIARGSLSRLTDGPTEDMLPLWSPDGERVFFASDRTGDFDIYSQPADGSTEARVELADAGFEGPNSFTPDGNEIVVTDEFRDLSVVDLEADTIRPLLHQETIDWVGEVSPDGNWLAYESDESGEQFEIYVRPYPDVTGRREKISIDGGRYVQWGPPASGEIYYVGLDGAMMAVPIELSPALRVGRAVKLFDFMPPGRGGAGGRLYDVSRVDGRFLRARAAALTPAGAGAGTVDVSVVLNWFDELRAQMAAR